ncbi:NACHT domain-containing protein [Amycolatopsis sp. NPDC051371]|uniref:NACHT domain-containing protein n=1 Tax=Amycolatopsis sp. NPDC051371 TaxID=3155800 RepID=UPI00341D8EB8
MSGRVDAPLAARIGAAAAQALKEHGEGKGCDYSLRKWFENGRTSAIVAAVYENDNTRSRTTKLVLKTVGSADEPIEEAEFARHRLAVEEAPGNFAQAHLARLWGDPIRVGDGTWLALQEVAGEGGGEIEPMAVLLGHVLGDVPSGAAGSGAVDIDPDGFARACGSVVGTVLHEWVGPPYTPDVTNVAAFLRHHTGSRPTETTRLLPYARQYAGQTIELDEEPGRLVNPFALAGGTFFGQAEFPMLSGRTHGDLHIDNVLMVAHPQVDDRKFFLIDLARYEPAGPVTRDPVHFVLHLLARHGVGKSVEHRGRLIDLLLHPEDRRAQDMLPAWVVKIVTAADSAGREWAKAPKLVDEWRVQTLLSLVGCSLRLLGRKSTKDEDRLWFLRLAARAAERFVASMADMPLAVGPVGQPASNQERPAAEPDGLSARSAFLRRTLHIRRVHQEVRRTLVDESVVPALVGEEPSAVVVRGDAGAGKSTIAGQIYDALAERDDVVPLVTPCQHIDELPTSVDQFDQAVGALIDATSSASVAVRELTAAGRRPVLILDTVDNLLEQRTAKIIVDFLVRVMQEGASVVLTTRPFHFNAWIKPHEARFAGALRAPVSVPLLDREEVLTLVAGYLRVHPSEHVPDARAFGERVWDMSNDRLGMQLIVRNPYFLLMLCETFGPAGVVPPEMTTSRLCDQYVQVRVYGSRKYPEGHDVLKGKRQLWQLVAGELWRRSGDRLALAVPQSWLDEQVGDQNALEDLLSEEVLVRSPADPTSVQFNHQFLAEFGMAIHLRDHGVAELHALLDGMLGAPGSRWFAWPIVRHVLARAHSTADLDATLDRMNLAENYAYQVAAQGLVEQAFPCYLAKLADYEQNYAALFELQVLYFVDDSKVGEALTLLTDIIVRGDAECAAQASAVAGRLAARSAEVALDNAAAIGGLLDAVLLVRERQAAASPRDASPPDQLLESVIGPLANRGVVLPADLLRKARSLVAGGTPVCARVVVRLHLVPGVAASERQALLTELLAYRSAGKVGELGADLVLRTVVWDLESDALPEPGGRHVRPADFLESGDKASGPLRAAALAAAAQKDPRLRPVVVEMFSAGATSSSEAGNRSLICLQEVIKRGGQAWLLAELAKRARQHPVSLSPRLKGVVKHLALNVPDREVRHGWADWLAPHLIEGRYTDIESYLLLGWDHDEHRKNAEKAYLLLPPKERESIVAKFAEKPAPGKEAVVRLLLKGLPDATPLVRVRAMDISGDHEPAGLVDLVGAEARLVSAQAMTRLEQAARAGSPWLRPEMLDRYANSDAPGIRAGVLKILIPLVRKNVGDVDGVVTRWTAAAADRPADELQGSAQEQARLLLLCHSYLRDDRGSAPAALAAIIRYVDRCVTSPVPREAGRELVALVKTAASRADVSTRAVAARWIIDLLNRIDIADVRAGRSFVKETLGKLLERGHLTLRGLTAQVKAWPSDNVKVVVDVIMRHDPAGNHSSLLDVLWDADKTGEVRSYIAAVRVKDR